jgi:hypothetical protein
MNASNHYSVSILLKERNIYAEAVVIIKGQIAGLHKDMECKQLIINKLDAAIKVLEDPKNQ